MFELKKMSREAIPRALEKAERYRLLREPEEAESICRDILRIDSGNQQALILLVLSITDQFGKRLSVRYQQAQEFLPLIQDEYERAYYAGIVSERRGKAALNRGVPDGLSVAEAWFRKAMECYEQAEALRPPGNDDALIRWNTCARLLMSRQREIEEEDNFEPMLE